MNDLLSNCSVDIMGGDMLLKKILANPSGLDVEDKPEWKCPRIGDKVHIHSFDGQCDTQESVRVARLPYLTISEIHPVCIGIGNDRYAWSYEIYVEETHLSFLQWHYKTI